MITPPLQRIQEPDQQENSMLYLFGTALAWSLSVLPFLSGLYLWWPSVRTALALYPVVRQ